MSVRVTILGSGSGGNCTVIATSRTSLMIDAGFSRLELLKRMAAVGAAPEALAAVLISHEHSDHVKGLPVLCRKLKLPALMNERTHAALCQEELEVERVEHFTTGTTFLIGDIEVTPFTIPHDAVDPVAFTFRAEGIKVALVTDLGYVPENVKHAVRGADLLIMESNHDLDMLKVGPYPWHLKQRVMSRVGHLSNDSLAEFLMAEFDGGAQHLVLAHLSENNNVPALARLAAEQALQQRNLATSVHIAEQHAPLPAFLF